MDLTVCICTHDRPRYLRDCLDGLRSQTIAENRFEVLIVDSGSPEPAGSELRDLVRQYPGCRLLRVEQPGVSAARNAGARAATSEYIAYIDDDAIPSETWVEAILVAIAERGDDRPAVLGGRILPKWEAVLPAWWPSSLRGLLSIVEHEGTGEYRTNELPPALEPYGCNMVVRVRSLLDAGGFGCEIGRIAGVLLSDEDIQLAWRLQDEGYSVRYDSNIVVFHQIQAKRLNPDWLLARLYWQGASTVLTRRLLHDGSTVWKGFPRRLLVAAVFAPFALLPSTSVDCLAIRWRQAYSAGFVRAALGWRAAGAARRISRKTPAAPSIAYARVPPPIPPPPIRVPPRVPAQTLVREPARVTIRAPIQISPHVPLREAAREAVGLITRIPDAPAQPAPIAVPAPLAAPKFAPLPIEAPHPQPVDIPQTKDIPLREPVRVAARRRAREPIEIAHRTLIHEVACAHVRDPVEVSGHVLIREDARVPSPVATRESVLEPSASGVS